MAPPLAPAPTPLPAPTARPATAINPSAPTNATAPQPPPSAPSPRLPETDPAYNEVVLSFLRKRGYHLAEEMLRKEIAGTTSSASGSTAASAVASSSTSNPTNNSSINAATSVTSSTGGGSFGTGSAPPPPGGIAGAPGSRPINHSGPMGTPTAGSTPLNKSNTTNLPNLIQRNNLNGGPSGRPPTPGGGNGPQGRSGTPPPVISSQLFDVMLQHLPSSALTTLGLTPPAATLERERKEKEDKERAGRILNGPIAANAIRVLEPGERIAGYDGLRAWVESGLEGWKAELRPLLFPVFVHTFFDLLITGFSQAAREFFAKHAPSHKPLHASTISTLSAISSSAHISASPLARRFRSEKYVLRMSKGGFGLLVGWLSSGGVEGEWDTGGRKERGKESVRGVINERVQVDVSPSTQPISPMALLTETGLLSAHIPAHQSPKSTSANGTSQQPQQAVRPSPATFNASQAPLKLGFPALGEKLAEEVRKVIKIEEAEEESRLKEAKKESNGMDVDLPAAENATSGAATTSGNASNPAVPVVTTAPGAGTSGGNASTSVGLGAKDKEPDTEGLLIPKDDDLLPLPVNFRTFDVKREVEKVLDSRKRIRLGPLNSSTTGSASAGPTLATAVGTADAKWEGPEVEGRVVLPSICAYTFHDSGEGITSTAFSADSSLLAAGSEESCVRLWSLKGEKLRGLRNDLDVGTSTDASFLRKNREKGGLAMRKLIGHSGPVYSLSFSPINGSAAPPRHLLSSSKDGTVRLWSLDTYSSLVAYKGHNEPVWDVEWGPMGAYFATGSRDRTARLWSTDRISALRMYVGHLGDVDCIKFHPNSLYLATGSSDRTCRLWDVQRGACVRLFVGHHDNGISSLAISPDGRYLASAAEDYAINIWDLGSSRLIKKMTGHSSSIHSLSFSAESSLLVSGSADCSVRVWDVKSSAVEAEQIVHQPALVPAATVTSNGAGELPMGGLKVPAKAAPVGIPDISRSLLSTYPTKRIPVLNVQFTPRNLCMIAGVYSPFDRH